MGYKYRDSNWSWWQVFSRQDHAPLKGPFAAVSEAQALWKLTEKFKFDFSPDLMTLERVPPPIFPKKKKKSPQLQFDFT